MLGPEKYPATERGIPAAVHLADGFVSHLRYSSSLKNSRASHPILFPASSRKRSVVAFCVLANRAWRLFKNRSSDSRPNRRRASININAVFSYLLTYRSGESLFVSAMESVVLQLSEC